MRYDLAYYKNIPQRDGDTIIRLEIYKKVGDRDIPLVNKEIGDVLTSLRLNIEGQGEDVDAPIVKTSLTFGVVDAPERNEAFVKCGDWEEFYTADATGWKVCLLGKRRNDSGFTMMWGGYVTPDSYTETLQYHGVVSITARDNIGHLQDFDYDAVGNGAGMITPYELINQAWEKIASPMRLDWRGEEDMNNWPQTEGVDAEQTYMNVAAFEGKTWYDAVTETLYAYGMVMRYTGRNSVSVCPLRRLPLQGRADYDYLPHVAPVFEAYATRELVPAVKEIAEDVAYELEEGAEQPLVGVEDFTGEDVSCTVNKKNVFGEVTQGTVIVNPIANAGDLGWGNIPSNTLFFNPASYTNSLLDKKAAEEQMFLATNTVDRVVWYGIAMQMENVVLRIERGGLIKSDSVGNITDALFSDSVSLRVAIKRTLGSVEEFYNGATWGTSYVEIDMAFEDGGVIEKTIPLQDAGGSGLLQVFIIRVDVDWKLGYPGGFATGAYLGIKALSFALPQTRSMMEKNTIVTKYNEANNVRMTRSPELGPAYDLVAFPSVIRNGVFRKDGDIYLPAPTWKWKADEDYDAAQLAVLVHKQLLAYYSKPNNLISGTIMNPHLLDPRVIWMWKGKEHFMQSGSFDYLNGVIDGATLREFMRYNQMWPLYCYLLTEDGQQIITEDGDYVQVGI
jgi:hypothetical protein